MIPSAIRVNRDVAAIRIVASSTYAAVVLISFSAVRILLSFLCTDEYLQSYVFVAICTDACDDLSREQP